MYFQVHQPWRLRRYSVFDTGVDYFDDAANAEILRKVADKCYRPATRLLLEMVRRHAGAFRVSFSVSGVALEQLERWAPDVVGTLRDLCATGCCEMLGETYHHALASLDESDEFEAQVLLHAARIEQLIGAAPRVFRNTELIYSDAIARRVAAIEGPGGEPRYRGMLCEGVDRLLGGRSSGFIYQPTGKPRGGAFSLLLRNARLSDDIAFRFSDRTWREHPLTPETYARWLDKAGQSAPLVNLFMDFETFGEHQWADTGIFEFLSRFPEKLLAMGDHRFLTASQAFDEFAPVATYAAPEPTSWADLHRDVSTWCGNAMQVDAIRAHAALAPLLHAHLTRGDNPDLARALLDDWRRLATSDHVYYMSTKGASDGDVHRYFSPFDSPYDAYITYLNVLSNLRARLQSE